MNYLLIKSNQTTPQRLAKCCTSFFFFVSFEEKVAWCNWKGAVPVDKDEVKGVPCFRGDALPDPGQHRDPRLRIECDP